VILVDINRAMLNVGRRRLADRGIVGNVVFVQADAEALPFDDDHFDCISIGFGLRNVTHMDRALVSMQRVLKPGGCLLVLEFSQPRQPLMAKVYDAYSFNVLPLLGRYVAHDEGSYRYLAESIRKHPDQEALKSVIEDAGFERVSYFNLSAGVVALHKAYKL
jgi:demethylmenaquinone methyltransferase/2-methoxy-6-polyprenyl-1,4-benzoquinol methylase